MGSTGAARRRQEQEPDQPPDGASVEADLRRVIAEAAVSAAMMRRHDSAVEAVIGKLEGLAAQCPDASRFGLLADGLAAQLVMLKLEGMGLAAHCEEARQACEMAGQYAQTVSFDEAMRRAAFEAGRQAGIAEEQARASRAPRSRPARHRKHLRPVPGIPATAVKAAVAAGIVAASVGGAVAMHEESSVRIVATSPRPAAVRFHAGPADSAVPVPSYTPRAYVPRHAKPSADAASASPAPSSSSVPSSSAPQPTVPAPTVSPVDFDGHLDLQTIAVTIGPDGTGTVVFSAVGGAASWSASAPAGLTLSRSGGTLEDGQPEVITVTAQPGLSAGAGVITLTDGSGHSVTVPVTWVAVPGLPL